MKVIITGAAGFVGRVLAKRFAQNNDTEVIGLSRHEMADADLSSLCNWAVTDYSVGSLKDIFEGADVVIHLAGAKGVFTELEEYDEDMHVTENILETMTEYKVGRIVYASSRLVYGNPENVPWTEETEPEPVLAYAKNKLRSESLCREWADKNGADAVILRIAQVLGEGEGTRNMINVFQDTARAGGELKVIGKSIAKRQYIYTADLAELIYRLTLRDENGAGIVNLGMKEAYTNLEIAEAINRAFHNETPINYDDSAPETITPSYMDVTKMLSLTDYVPMDMDRALADMY